MSWFDNEKVGKTQGQFPPSLKLPVGESIVEVLAEPEFKEVADMTDKEKLIEKAIIPVKYHEQEFNWWMSRTFLAKKDGSPNDTLFAQLAVVAKSRGGLAGVVLKVVRFGTGKGTRYMVQAK